MLQAHPNLKSIFSANEGSAEQVADVQACRMIELAGQLAISPNRADLVGVFMTYAIQFESWRDRQADFDIDALKTIGLALFETGQFAAARPWYERAAAVAEKANQFDFQALHRVSERFGQRTGIINQIRAFILERGIALLRDMERDGVGLNYEGGTIVDLHDGSIYPATMRLSPDGQSLSILKSDASDPSGKQNETLATPSRNSAGGGRNCDGGGRNCVEAGSRRGC
jgi:hypothetical protein